MAMTNKARSLVKLSDSDLELADRAEDIRGRKVLDKNGDEIGHVDDLFVDETASKVRFLQVAAGGFLGLGEKKFLVPVNAITRIDDQHVHIDQTRQRVMGAPEYNPTLEEKDDNDYWSGLYGYYGYTPYWGPGYTYPPYPYYRLP
jgi:sporulation protein YlmC with PRC-barrel domain